MKYATSNPTEAKEAIKYLNKLIASESLVEITKKSPNRSLNQNSYLHLLLTDFGLHFGYTLKESKQLYKEINKDIYQYTKNKRVFYRSSADLTKDEMMKSIDRFMEKSNEAGHPLPLATDQGWLRNIENEGERMTMFL